jgi:hypothetical protein
MMKKPASLIVEEAPQCATISAFGRTAAGRWLMKIALGVGISWRTDQLRRARQVCVFTTFAETNYKLPVTRLRGGALVCKMRNRPSTKKVIVRRNQR